MERHVESHHKMSVGGVAVETLAAVGAVVLSILGLAGLFPIELAAISAIAIGVALLFEGFSVRRELRVYEGNVTPRSTMGEIGVESLAGLGAVTLGIIALVGAASTFALLPIAAIVIGGGLLFAAHPLSEATHVTHYYDSVDKSRVETQVQRGASASASGTHAFAGVAAVVLGIIGLTMPAVVALSLVAFLAVGGTLMLASAAVGGRVAGYFSH